MPIQPHSLKDSIAALFVSRDGFVQTWKEVRKLISQISKPDRNKLLSANLAYSLNQLEELALAFEDALYDDLQKGGETYKEHLAALRSMIEIALFLCQNQRSTMPIAQLLKQLEELLKT